MEAIPPLVGTPTVDVGRFLRSARSGWDFELHAPPPLLLVDATRVAPAGDNSTHFRAPQLLLEEFVATVLQLLQHSQTLSSRPEQKAALWAATFPTFGRARELQLGLEHWMLEAPAFPRAVLSFHQSKVTPETLAALLRSFTSSEKDETERGGTQLTTIGLKFTQSPGFGLHELQLLLSFLDALFAHDSRTVTIDSLDLSHNELDAEALTLLSKLLRKNQRVYRIRDVALHDICFSRQRESDEADAIAALLRVVFSEPFEERLCESASTSPFFTMTRLSFDHTSLRLQHFAGLCASLRYGCLVHDLSLLSTLNRVSADDRKQCWRWLAFALFYPRSSRLQMPFALTKIDLSRIELRVADAKAVKSTLADPAAELVFDGRRPAGEAVESVRMRWFASGSRVFEAASASSRCLATLHYDRELEVLARGVDTWVCVVWPGVGVGWTQYTEPPSEPSECLSCDYDATQERLYELTAHRLSSKTTPITRLLESIGRHVRLLSLKFNSVDVAAITTHCIHLQHLDLEGCSFRGSSIDALFAPANRRFFYRLESLNLNDTDISSHSIDRLAQVLTSQESRAKLQELRLVTNDASEPGSLARICDMLATNKALVVLELPQLHASVHSPSLVDTFDGRFRGELLRIVDAPGRKRAFLSVLAQGRGAGSSLDADLVAAIFAFAGTPVHRRILWRLSSNGED